MKKICLLLLVFNSVYAQPPGQWMWIHGSSTPGGPASWGIQGVPAPTNVPPALYEACQWTDLNGNFWLFGGMDNSVNVYSALWKYNPVINQWTWMKGPNTPNFAGNYGVQGVPSPANLPPAVGWGAVTWTDLLGNLWMLGGSAAVGGILSALWKYEISTNTWTWMKGPNTGGDPGVYGTQGVPNINNTPRARAECAASWTDNAGDLWVFGGYYTAGSSANDLWRYNIATNTWTWMKGSSLVNQVATYGTLTVENPANTPGARWVYAHWKDSQDNLWIMGGSGSSAGYLNDLWRYNPITNNWAWMSGSNFANATSVYGTMCDSSAASVPGARFENRSVVTDQNGNFWLFGGATGGSFSNTWNDLWMYCVLTNRWTWVSGANTTNPAGNWGTIGVPSPTNRPNGRGGALAWYDGSSHFYMFGGVPNSFSNFYNDLWKYTIDFNNCYPCSQQLLPLIVTATNDTTVCWGVCTNISATASGGDPPYTYSWTPNIGNGAGPYQVCPTVTTTYYITVTDSLGTTATDSVTITVNPLPVLVTSSPASACVGGSAVLTVSGASTYSWLPCTNLTPCTGSSVTATPASSTSYTVIGTDVNGCVDTANYVVNVFPNPSPVITPSGPVQFCAGNSVDLTANPTGSYLWSSSDTTQSVHVTQSGIFTVVVTDVNGCTGVSAPQSVIVHPLPVLASAITDVLCNGGNTGIMTVMAGGGSFPYTYQWTPNAGTGATINNLLAGSYTVTVTDSAGCVQTLTDTVAEPPPISVAMSSVNTNCDSLIGQAGTTPSGGTPGYTYLWSNGQSASTITGLAGGTYTVTVTDINNCTVTDSVAVVVNPGNVAISLSDDTTIMLGTSVQLYSAGGVNYYWQPPDGLNCTTCPNPKAHPLQTTDYCVRVSDSSGCYDTACMRVSVIVTCGGESGEIFVPDAFSPNDDGANDVLFAYGTGMKEFYFAVYDRWGEKVFESTDPGAGWNGSLRGKPLDPAVFVYLLRVKCIGGQEISQKGNVSLFR